jgi:hypothetical protein
MREPSYSLSDLQDLTDVVNDAIDGNAGDLCVSALLTVLVGVITSTAHSAVEAKEVTEHVHELIAPAAVAELWTSTNHPATHH